MARAYLMLATGVQHEMPVLTGLPGEVTDQPGFGYAGLAHDLDKIRAGAKLAEDGV
jgi:hypothetical protein